MPNPKRTFLKSFTTPDGHIYALYSAPSGVFEIWLDNRISSIHSDEQLAQTRYKKYVDEFGKKF